MVTQQTPFLLKVLSGSNAGALVRLKVGEILIGKSMSSDIILHDENIADSHLRLKISLDSILLEVLANPVLIDNQEVEASEKLLRPYQVVTIGSVDFFIADVRRPGRLEDEVTVGHEAVDTGQVSHPVPVATRRADSGRNALAARQARTGSKKYLWLGGALLLGANLLYFMPSLMNMAEQVGLRESTRQRADAIVADMKSDKLQVMEAGNNVLITGYVDTVEEKRNLMSRTGASQVGVNYRIWVMTELVESAKSVAHALGQADLGFKSLGEGRLSAHGYVSNEEDWARIKTNIMGDVSGIRSIDDSEVQTLRKRKEALEQFIEKKGLSSRIRVTIEQDRIKVDGELTQSELSRWSDLYKEFLVLNGDGPAIIENLFDARKRIKLVIRSVSVGKTPFLVSKDGKKYMEGATLGNNYFIRKITPDHVLLSNGGVEIPIFYGAED
ncbi:MAG TPA: type III secretion system inner membrane ring subunit SctD [Thiolinea sp.]|nr:type III secretion system inner membrane ring subunit SctD [Thiolinea sp.]